jgi:hypothetical protein
MPRKKKNEEVTNEALQSVQQKPATPETKKQAEQPKPEKKEEPTPAQVMDFGSLSTLNSKEFDGTKKNQVSNDNKPEVVAKVDVKPKRKYIRRNSRKKVAKVESLPAAHVVEVGNVFMAAISAKGAQLIAKKPVDINGFFLTQEEKSIIVPQVEAVLAELTDGKEMKPVDLLAITLATIYAGKIIQNLV